MAFRGDTDDDEVESDGFFSRIWDKFVEYLGSILVAIIMFFPYIIGPVIALIFIFL